MNLIPKNLSQLRRIALAVLLASFAILDTTSISAQELGRTITSPFGVANPYMNASDASESGSDGDTFVDPETGEVGHIIRNPFGVATPEGVDTGIDIPEEIDGTSQEAQRLKQEAERHLKPVLKIRALAEGQEVTAKVDFGNGNVLSTGGNIEGFTEGKEYSGTVTYQRGENTYEGTFSYTGKKGETVKVVTLKKSDFTKIALTGTVSLELVKVESGSFTMSAKDGENFNNEKSHPATLTKDYYIGKYEVTQEQWEAVMVSNPSHFKGAKLPVEQVSWYAAMEFCEKLNEQGKAPAGYHFTLPTETQWEYAAKGGNKSQGYKYSGSNTLGEVAWYDGNSGSKTHEVGTKTANELGLYDMSGNVWEWCLDDYTDNSSKAKAEFTCGKDSGSTNRVGRGGSWYNYARNCRAARRHDIDPLGAPDDLGFRVALAPGQY